VYIGSFSTEQQAAHAYDLKASELKGADAVLNFPIKGGGGAAALEGRSPSSDFRGVSWNKYSQTVESTAKGLIPYSALES